MRGPSESESEFADLAHVKRERELARELRASAWWKQRRSNGLCHYCGHLFPVAELTMDHVVPIGRGGRSTKGNVVPACKACNTRKKHRLVWETESGEPSRPAARTEGSR